MKRLVMCAVCYVVCALFLTPSAAAELIWTPINPSFGGSPFNGAWLLNSAQIQNKFKEPVKEWGKRDPIEDFKNSLNRQILYKLARKVIDSAFGEEGLEAGHYNLGDYTIDVGLGADGIRIVLIDIQTGNETIIEVPYY